MNVSWMFASFLLLSASFAAQAQTAPRTLSEQDLAKIRERMATGKVVREEQAKQAELRRQEDERRRAEEDRIAQMEADAQAEWEAMQADSQPQSSSGGFAEALLHGMNVLQDEMAKHEVERAQQQAFLDDVRRQSEAVAWEREREIERERQRVAEERRRREQAMAQQRQATMARTASPSGPATSQSSAVAATPEANNAQARDQALREQAAAERQRLQAQRAAEEKATADRQRKAEADRLARERADAERKREEEQRRLAQEQQLRQVEQSLRSGFRGKAATCIGGGKDIFYLQTSTPSKTGCNVSFEARCPGTPAGAGIRFSQANYIGGSCQGLGDNIRIGQMSCAAEQVQVSMTGAQCG